MFNKFKNKFQKRQKPVYLGDIAVVPRNNLKRLLEFGWESSQTDEELRAWIVELLDMPVFPKNNLSNDYLVLDVVVSKYQCGTDAILWSDSILPLLWRPSIKIHGRLKSFDGKVICTYQTKKSMPWRKYLGKTINPANWYRTRGSVNINDMRFLVAQGLLDILKFVKKAV